MDKKILIISRGFRAGDAITTLNLLSLWPKKNIYCASLVDSEYTKEVEEFYHLGDKEIKLNIPYNYITKPTKSYRGSKETPKYRTIGKSLLGKIYEKIGRPTLQWLDLYENRLTININEEFKEWISEIKPDVIYTSVGDRIMAEFILSIHQVFPNIRLIVHCFDDWLTPPYKVWDAELHRKKSEKIFKKILSIADARFTSSEKMANDYQAKYCKSFISFPNPVVLNTRNKNKQVKRSEYHIIFTGKISWHNHKAISQVIKALEELNTVKKEYVLDIYTDTKASVVKNLLGSYGETVLIHPPVPNKDVPNILDQGDILLLPISMDKHTVRFTKYSMSTKMGEYLSSGVPMLYLGPKDIAMTDFLRDQDCCIMVTENKISSIKDAIGKCISAKENTILLERAKDVAEKTFNSETVGRKFHDAIMKVCHEEN